MKKVLINKPIHQDAINRLKEEVEVLTPFDRPAADVVELLAAGVHGLVLCAGLDFNAAAMDRCKTLEVIGRHGAGMDFVDLDAATQRGIPVTYTPEGPPRSTAEHAFMLMMAAARKLPYLDHETRAGNFHVRDKVVGRELRGLKVGVIGFGRIGRRFAEMCRAALEMQVYAYDPFMELEAVEDWGAIYMPDLMAMAKVVDVLSIHCPLQKETQLLVSREVIAAMKPDAFLISASRGLIVDEAALIEALQQKRIAGAGIDVYSPEPPAKDNPLFVLDNVVLTPHLASFTDEGRRRMGLMVVEDVLRVLRRERPVYPANPGVLKF